MLIHGQWKHVNQFKIVNQHFQAFEAFTTAGQIQTFYLYKIAGKECLKFL